MMQGQGFYPQLNTLMTTALSDQRISDLINMRAAKVASNKSNVESTQSPPKAKKSQESSSLYYGTNENTTLAQQHLTVMR